MRRLALAAVVAMTTGCWATGGKRVDSTTTLVIGAAILTGLVISVAADHGDSRASRDDQPAPAPR